MTESFIGLERQTYS